MLVSAEITDFLLAIFFVLFCGCLMYISTDEGERSRIYISIAITLSLVSLTFVFIIGGFGAGEKVGKQNEKIPESNVSEHVLENGDKILIIENENGGQEVIEIPKKK